MEPLIGVADYYAGKSIFITGATGFMGKVLVEKLLRSCPGVKTLYLLMRTKKGLSVEQRIQSYVNCEVFDRIQAECPKRLLKLRMVPGDVTSDQLGISVFDLEEMQREVQVIFHCAASVRFDMFIRDAVEINVHGTFKMLKFAETLNNLEVFLHMSTAYCHDDLEFQEEVLYPAKHNPHDIIHMVRWMDDDMLRSVEKKLIHPLPNTYSYTKALSEDLVAEYAGKFPIVIARPSVVTAAVQEPIPGWVDNLNNLTGLLVGGAKGVFRVLHTYKEHRPDLIPVDIAVNCSIIMASIIGSERPKEIKVLNITNAGVVGVTMVDLLDILVKNVKKYPFSQCLWYPHIGYQESRLLYQLHALLVHWLPALFIDMLLILFRRKPFMINIQKRLHHGLDVMDHYLTGQWIFKNDTLLSIRHRVKKEEREIFFTELELLNENLVEYGEKYHLGARQYCSKDPLSTLPKAKRLYKLLYYLQLTFRVIFLWCFINIVYLVAVKIIY